jgi:hypothetical protein
LHEALQELKEHLTLADQLYLHVSPNGEASALVFGPQRIVTRPVDVKHDLEQDLLVSVCHGYMDKALALLKESHKVTLRLKKGEPEHALMFIQGDSRDTLALMPMRREAAVVSYVTRSAA